MLPAEQKRFDHLYARHLQALKLQGKSRKTIDACARAVRRIAKHFDRCPDTLTTAQLQRYFSELVDSHSWSTVKVGRNGQIHIRRGKGHKDRLIPLPDLTCQALRTLWRRHRHPRWLFPLAAGPLERIRQATTHMDRGGAQSAMKAARRSSPRKRRTRAQRS